MQHLDRVIRAHVAQRLDARVVLVRPDVGHAREGLRRARLRQQVAGHLAALVDHVRPVLHPHLFLEDRVVPAAHVPDGVDAGGRGQGRVADDAVPQLQPRALQPARLRRDPDPHDHQVRLHRRPVREQHALDPLAALEAGHERVAAHVHAALAMKIRAGFPDLRADRVRERRRQRLDERDLEPRATRDRGHLRADEPRPHHRHPWPLRQLGADAHRVVDGAQRVDARKVGRVRERSRRRPRRDDERVETDGLTVAQREFPLLNVETLRPYPQPQVESQLVDGVGCVQQRLLGFPLARQQLLREGWSVVGVVGLRPDEGERSLEFAPPAQRLRGAKPTQGGAGDDDAVGMRHRVILWSARGGVNRPRGVRRPQPPQCPRRRSFRGERSPPDGHPRSNHRDDPQE